MYWNSSLYRQRELQRYRLTFSYPAICQYSYPKAIKLDCARTHLYNFVPLTYSCRTAIYFIFARYLFNSLNTNLIKFSPLHTKNIKHYAIQLKYIHEISVSLLPAANCSYL